MKAILAWTVTCSLVLLAALFFRALPEKPTMATIPGLLFLATLALAVRISKRERQ